MLAAVARTSASHLSTSCTSRVQSWSGMPGNSSSVKGPVRSVQASRVAVVRDDARQSHFLAGQAGQVFGLDRRYETGKGIADQQRLLLPVVAQELSRRHAERDAWRLAWTSIMGCSCLRWFRRPAACPALGGAFGIGAACAVSTSGCVAPGPIRDHRSLAEGCGRDQDVAVQRRHPRQRWRGSAPARRDGRLRRCSGTRRRRWRSGCPRRRSGGIFRLRRTPGPTGAARGMAGRRDGLQASGPTVTTSSSAIV